MVEAPKEHKTFPGIGACGIDCCLCPMHHVRDGDGCPGCTAPTTSGRKGRWCAIARCAVQQRNHETCAECNEYPCERLSGIDEDDSFVTHRNTLVNLHLIRTVGLRPFLSQQKRRRAILREMLAGFDDGRSKSHFCTACALLPVEGLETALGTSQMVIGDATATDDRTMRAQVLRQALKDVAARSSVDLRLRRLRGEDRRG